MDHGKFGTGALYRQFIYRDPEPYQRTVQMIPITELRPADMFVLSPPSFQWDDLLPNHIPTTILHRGIQAKQREEFPDGDCYPVHVAVYLGQGQFFEVTAPKPRIGEVTEISVKIEKGWRVDIYRQRGYAWTISDQEMLREIVIPMLAKKYAYEDYIPFILESVIGYLNFTFLKNVLGNKWRNWIYLLARLDQSDWVCSTGATAVIAAAHKTKPEIPRPFKESNGEPMFIEKVTPARFANSPADYLKYWSSVEPV